MAKLRMLRDLQEMPDDQAYLCSDRTVAVRHKLEVPFRCGCREWVGGGVVNIEFYSKRDGFTGYQTTDYADIRTLEPIDAQWEFDYIPPI